MITMAKDGYILINTPLFYGNHVKMHDYKNIKINLESNHTNLNLIV